MGLHCDKISGIVGLYLHVHAKATEEESKQALGLILSHQTHARTVMTV